MTECMSGGRELVVLVLQFAIATFATESLIISFQPSLFGGRSAEKCDNPDG